MSNSKLPLVLRTIVSTVNPIGGFLSTASPESRDVHDQVVFGLIVGAVAVFKAMQVSTDLLVTTGILQDDPEFIGSSDQVLVHL